MDPEWVTFDEFHWQKSLDYLIPLQVQYQSNYRNNASMSLRVTIIIVTVENDYTVEINYTSFRKTILMSIREFNSAPHVICSDFIFKLCISHDFSHWMDPT